MSGINKAILVGNVGKDPEIRSLQNGNRVATFSLATSETWRDKNSGERKERTEWHRCVCFDDNLVRVLEAYVQKGTKLYLEGQIQTRKWQDQSGQDRYSTEIVLQRFKSALQILGGGRAQSESSEPAGNDGGGTDLDDEIPF